MCIAKSGAPGGAKRSDPLRRTMRAAKKRHPPRSPPSQGGYRHTESVCAVVQSKTRNAAPRDAGSAKRRPSRDAKNTKRRPIARRKKQSLRAEKRLRLHTAHGAKTRNVGHRGTRETLSVGHRGARMCKAPSHCAGEKQNLRAAAAPCAPKSACVSTRHTARKRETSRRRGTREVRNVGHRIARNRETPAVGGARVLPFRVLQKHAASKAPSPNFAALPWPSSPPAA